MAELRLRVARGNLAREASYLSVRSLGALVSHMGAQTGVPGAGRASGSQILAGALHPWGLDGCPLLSVLQGLNFPSQTQFLELPEGAASSVCLSSPSQGSHLRTQQPCSSLSSTTIPRGPLPHGGAGPSTPSCPTSWSRELPSQGYAQGWVITESRFYSQIFFFFFLVAPTACGSSWAKE